MGDADFGFSRGDAIIVTGAGSGIGRATARRAAQMGLGVSAWDLDATTVARTVAEIVEAGGSAHAVTGDVGDQGVVDAGIAEATARFGTIRFLHNNAGPPSSIPLDFDDALVQCIGSIRRMTDAWAATEPGPGAAMVATASVAGTKVGTDSAWYSASKAGIVGYVRHLTAYRSSEFRSNAVGPGMVDTPRLTGFAASEVGRRVLARVPLGRMASPDDIAYAALFLLSPLAAYINGAFLPVDGGWTVTQ